MEIIDHLDLSIPLERLRVWFKLIVLSIELYIIELYIEPPYEICNV